MTSGRLIAPICTILLVSETHLKSMSFMRSLPSPLLFYVGALSSFYFFKCVNKKNYSILTFQSKRSRAHSLSLPIYLSLWYEWHRKLLKFERVFLYLISSFISELSVKYADCDVHHVVLENIGMVFKTTVDSVLFLLNLNQIFR